MKTKLSLALALLLVVFLLLSGTAKTSGQPAGGEAIVAYVIDGDTVAINTVFGLDIIRLIGVNTPETKHPTKPPEYYGVEASRFTRNLLKGERISYQTDQVTGLRDRYNRLLAYVYRAPDGLFVNAEIVRQGYGRVERRFPFRFRQLFDNFERFAIESEKGLWNPYESK